MTKNCWESDSGLLTRSALEKEKKLLLFLKGRQYNVGLYSYSHIEVWCDYFSHTIVILDTFTCFLDAHIYIRGWTTSDFF